MSHLERLEETARFCHQVVSMLSHDLRSPLSSIVMSIRRLQKDHDQLNSNEALATLSQIERSVNGMLEMIDYILDTEKLSTGTLELIREQFNLKNLADEVIEKISEVGQLKGISVQNSTPAETSIYGDRILVGRVLHNLLTNALKFCQRGDRITLTYQNEKISVIDTGPGISTDLIPKIFQPTQTTLKGSAGEAGFGLGLPGAYKIIKAHGGELSVSSEPGKGAAFYISLPEYTPHITIVSASTAFEARIQADLNAIYGGKTHWSTYPTIRDCMLALDQLHQELPNILVIDSRNAENESFSLCHKLRNHFLGSEITILIYLLEANHDDEITWLEKEAIQAGADAFFTQYPNIEQLAKPLDR